MNNIAFLLILPIFLSACSRGFWHDQSAEWNALKARCLAQDYVACSDIGHMAQQARGDATF